jgi:glycosyltransferase involved in cell wall biosynthesis
MMKKPKITLLTCTHNGEKTIEQVLEAIADQTDVSRDLFEVLIIDNASNDYTSEIAKDAIKRLNLNGRVLLEPRPGKINAFVKGVQEAQGELISIIDDDNFIKPGFIFYTLELFEQYPTVGMTGSLNCISIDQSVPLWFEWVKGRYACSQPLLDEIETSCPDKTLVAKTAIIAGAGSTFLVKPVRRCLESGYSFFNDTQRGKKMKVTGEDLELCWLLRSLGYRFAYNPRIQLDHAIKPERLNLEQFKILCKTIGAGSLGIDPFLFVFKFEDGKWPLQWSWQWQLISKLKRYFKLIALQFFQCADERQRFLNWRDRVECWGAIQRILVEREKYTAHIRQVAMGEWTQFRVR